MTDRLLQITELSFAYGGKTAIDNVSLDVDRGEFVGIIGPNGSGKSTLLKNVYRALRPSSGSIKLDGQDLLAMSFRRSAQRMAVVGQENDVPFNFSVEEIVAMGRTPHKKLFDIDTDEDRQIVHHALEHLGIEDMAQRDYLSLSGGEKQRVIIARAMAQECDFLVLDEPTNHLDISYQLQIFDFVKHINATVLAAIHDLNLAALYCDRLYVLDEGRVAYTGTPEEVLTAEHIKEIYHVDCQVRRQEETGKISIIFIPDKKGVGLGHTAPHTHEWAQPVEHEHDGYRHTHAHPHEGHTHSHDEHSHVHSGHTHSHDEHF